MAILRLPQSIQIETTNACNLRCKMCPSNSPLNEDYTRNRTLIEWDLFTRIIDEAATFPKCHIIPQGGGEPFLHPRFRDMLIYAKSKPNLTIGFVTNGTKAKPGDPELLVDLGIEEVVVSVYGYDEASHLAVTGRDNHEKVVAFLRELGETRQRRASKIPRVRVQAVDVDIIKPERERFVRRWLDHADEVALLTQRDFSGRGFVDGQGQPLKQRPCRKLWHETAISSDGDLGICCEDWNVDYPLGNIREKSIRELWYGHELERIRKAHKSGNANDIDLCRECYMLYEEAPQVSEQFGMRTLRSPSVTIYRREWA